MTMKVGFLTSSTVRQLILAKLDSKEWWTMTRRAMTMFTGGGGADVGLIAAGWQVVAGLEYDPDIAAVANANLGGHVRVGDVLDANPDDFPDCDLLHASPPCPSFSVAKADGKETDHDIAMARKVAEFVTVKRPRLFTLENVRGYKDSQSFTIICEALRAAGYKWRVVVLNSADFGVPQTRMRLFILAGRDHLPPEPRPTHQKGAEGQPTLFEVRLPKWIGWYEAIGDLVEGLPESKFAEWQLKRLPDELRTMLLSSAFPESNGKKHFEADEPAYQPCTQALSRTRAFLVTKQEQCQKIRDINPRDQDEPSATVTADDYRRPSSVPKAFIVPGGNQSARAIQEEEPMFTIGSVDRVGNIPRAFIAAVQGEASDYREESDPSPTITTAHGAAKYRACLPAGRVVKMTPRCLARFQSFPDSYALPEKDALACRIIGNAVPPLLYQRIVEALDSGANIA